MLDALIIRSYCGLKKKGGREAERDSPCSDSAGLRRGEALLCSIKRPPEIKQQDVQSKQTVEQIKRGTLFPP